MIFIIDGHNLVPKVPGLNLSDLDDENELIRRLQKFCLEHRHQARVFFDRAPNAQSGKRSHGNVTAYFVRQGKTADQAIREHLQNAGQQAQHWTVISSDNEVRQSGKWARCALISSAEFARMMLEPAPGKPGADTAENPDISTDEVDEWMSIFGRHGKEK